ncbi:hypothetical protein ACQKO7_22015, partial [Pseudomonas putida]|uniref:hypothetical protein n=1 Tax=Pseudomonas putida TaxID=303 RepID=UPI003D012A03
KRSVGAVCGSKRFCATFSKKKVARRKGGRGQQRRYTKMDLPPVSTPAPTKPNQTKPNQTKPNQTKPQQARIREQKKWAT